MRNGYKQYTNIAGIKNSTVFLKDRTMLAVIEVDPIDFDKLSETKKDKVTKTYNKWISSLDYPVQIVSRAINRDIINQAKILKNGIEHSIKQKEEYRDLLALFKDFETWFDNYLKNNSKKSRSYYLVIPYVSSKSHSLIQKLMKKGNGIEDFKILDKRVNHAVEALSKTGVKMKRLDDEDLDSLYFSYFMISNHSRKGDKSLFNGPEQWFMKWKEYVKNREV